MSQTPTGAKKCRVGVMDDFGSLMDVLTICIDAPSIRGKLKEQTDGASDAFQCLRCFIPQSQQTWHPAHQEDACLEDLDSQTRKQWEEFKGPTSHQ
ncbi:hypothetical protein SCLCIDRAFT_1221923 [Scleroderma citrinum Foug A]|uniref:Uncharacterized protein n=1 Tax=Scleroderma citrinum Foug A TaxID=1036808 RepID=A0A0C3D125_9AGAM|nr:hypothetical protein SCLCIDRAFT_1221923 [Scleroderma citrinum Foug A]